MCIRDRVPGGFGGVRVDEVTRDAHPSEEVSGRREATQGRADRGHDRRVRADCRRAGTRDQDRAGPGRDPRSRPLCLSDLCQGCDAAAREPQALRRRAEGPARGCQGGARRGFRGNEEGRAPGRARPDARAGRGRRPRAGGARRYRPHAQRRKSLTQYGLTRYGLIRADKMPRSAAIRPIWSHSSLDGRPPGRP